MDIVRKIVIKSFVTDYNKILINGDIVYLRGNSVYYKRTYAGEFTESNFNDYFDDIR